MFLDSCSLRTDTRLNIKYVCHDFTKKCVNPVAWWWSFAALWWVMLQTDKYMSHFHVFFFNKGGGIGQDLQTYSCYISQRLIGRVDAQIRPGTSRRSIRVAQRTCPVASRSAGSARAVGRICASGPCRSKYLGCSMQVDMCGSAGAVSAPRWTSWWQDPAPWGW